ncbi:MAG: hypothetical protein HF314_07510 [Ignavibacteria bacterium]|nr:hypothetical protein [Ignavibacteria bacterium]MCU7502903.1 hypothetical protein [Ignavibacteria bacterium]MCU7515603.1 hypothetical protein [Ignavibacteria bacterium]
MNRIAETYVRLVLNVGQYDDGYVDAYYGPREWKPAELNDSAKKNFPYEKLTREADRLLSGLSKIPDKDLSEIEKLRRDFLKAQISAVRARIEILHGKKMTFDQESRALYDAVAPVHDRQYFESRMKEFQSLLPGEGDILERYEKFRNQFIIPKDKLDAVFTAAINECRRRTLEHIKLPEGENFKVEYVKDKPWGAYNWYKGNAFSLIEVNTELPTYIDGPLGLASHEGYPGHHVYNALLEEKLAKGKGWIEFTVYPLYSPQSLIAEGSANFGIEMIFPGDERLSFEKNVLFPLAGLDTSKAGLYYQLRLLINNLQYAGTEAARNYLDGKFTKEETIDWLMKYNLMSKERAERLLRFFEHYRSYDINYTLGQDIIKNYIEKNGGTEADPEKRWEIFKKILSTPQTPEALM